MGTEMGAASRNTQRGHLVAVKKLDKNGNMVTRHVLPTKVSESSKIVPAVGSSSPGKRQLIASIKSDVDDMIRFDDRDASAGRRIMKRANGLPEETAKYFNDLITQRSTVDRFEIVSTISELLDKGFSPNRMEDVILLLDNTTVNFGEIWSDTPILDDGTRVRPRTTFGENVLEPLCEILRGMESLSIDEVPYVFSDDNAPSVRSMSGDEQKRFLVLADHTLAMAWDRARTVHTEVGDQRVIALPVEDVKTIIRHWEHHDALTLLYQRITPANITALMFHDHGQQTAAMIDLINASISGRWQEDWVEKNRLCDGGEVNEETGEITYSVDLYGPRIADLAATYPDRVAVVADFIDNLNNSVVPAKDDPELVQFLRDYVPALRDGML